MFSRNPTRVFCDLMARDICEICCDVCTCASGTFDDVMTEKQKDAEELISDMNNLFAAMESQVEEVTLITLYITPYI